MASSDPLKLFYDHGLYKFLIDHRTDSKDPSLTHTTGSIFKGKWNIDDNYKDFYNLLHDYLFIKKGKTLNIVEHPRNKAKPLVIDLDFHYPIHNNLIRTFDNSHVLKFIEGIGSTLKKFFHIENYEVLRFFITMRPGPQKAERKPYIKDGVHILCPDIILNNDKQSVIRNDVLLNNCLKTAFENTGYNNPDTEVYDVSMTRKQGWYPYGESKADIPAYELTNVIEFNPIDSVYTEEDINNYSNRDLLELLSVRHNICEDNNEVKEELKEEYCVLLNKFIVKKEEVEEETIPIQNEILQEFLTKTQSEQEKNVIQRLVMECLDKSRADDRDLWMRVGWALHNIDKSECMFNLWMDFSRQSVKFRDNNIHELKNDFFHKMKRTNDNAPKLTERSLHNWAKKDNPQKYKEIISDYINEYIQHEVDGTNYHIALLLKRLYKNNYIASVNNRDTDWFFYDDEMNMWKHINQGIQLKKKISTDVAQCIKDVEYKVSQRAHDPNTREQARKILYGEIEKFQKIQKNLYTNAFVEATMKMAQQVFCDEDFMTKLNRDPFLLACRNGVLQLRVNTIDKPYDHVIFRNGIPEDYLSFLTGNDFPEHEPINYIPYDAKNPVFNEIKDFFSKIFPNKELREYFLRILASCIEGTNREQCFYIWEGVGGNGKSKVVELMRLTFGDYQTSLQSTVLTRKKPQSGAANPDIMAIKNKRFTYLQEPDYKEPLNTSLMKQFSGEDVIEARALFKDQEKFKITGKLHMMCNSKPMIETMDRGTWRRIRVIPFVSKFVEHDSPELLSKKKNVFVRDNDLDKKLIQWREPFLSLLVHIYETQYLKNGLEPIPEIVKKACDDYKESNDSFAKFENDRIRKVNPLEGVKITFKEIDRSYRKWVVDVANGARKLNQQDLLKRVNDEYGEPEDGKYYRDRKVFLSEEDVEEYDIA